MTQSRPPAAGGSSLPAALEALVAVGTDAGLDSASVRDEGRRLAAGVLETARPSTVHLGWRAVMGGSVQDFFDDASRGRRFASGPTPLLAELVAESSSAASAYAAALSEVASAACTVEGAGHEAVGKAHTMGAAQVSAGGRHVGGRTGSVAPPAPFDPFAGGTAPATGRSALDLTPGEQPQSRAPLTAKAVLDQLGAMSQVTRDSLLRHLPGAHQPDFPQPELHQPGFPPSGLDQPGVDPSGAPTSPHDPASPGAPAPAAAAPAAPSEPEPEPEPQRSLDELMAELDGLIGLSRVKREIHRQVAMLEVDAKRVAAGLKSATLTRHLVFVGNPGTGKTTVARLVGGIYRALGLLSKGQLVEVDRSELVAGYLGQTAAKTAEICASAIGGVLFIDEAYTLAGDQYGQEAVDTLVKEMEDHRDELVVIVAGYPEPMRRFIDTNPGLASRFRTSIDFENYTDEEITDILLSLAAQNDYDLSPAALTRFREILAATPRDDSFGNGRFARNTLEGAIGRHAWRLHTIDDPAAVTLETLRTIEMVDLDDHDDLDAPAVDDDDAGDGDAGALDLDAPGAGVTDAGASTSDDVAPQSDSPAGAPEDGASQGEASDVGTAGGGPENSGERARAERDAS